MAQIERELHKWQLVGCKIKLESIKAAELIVGLWPPQMMLRLVELELIFLTAAPRAAVFWLGDQTSAANTVLQPLLSSACTVTRLFLFLTLVLPAASRLKTGKGWGGVADRVLDPHCSEGYSTPHVACLAKPENLGLIFSNTDIAQGLARHPTACGME